MSKELSGRECTTCDRDGIASLQFFHKDRKDGKITYDIVKNVVDAIKHDTEREKEQFDLFLVHVLIARFRERGIDMSRAQDTAAMLVERCLAIERAQSSQ